MGAGLPPPGGGDPGPPAPAPRLPLTLPDPSPSSPSADPILPEAQRTGPAPPRRAITFDSAPRVTQSADAPSRKLPHRPPPRPRRRPQVTARLPAPGEAPESLRPPTRHRSPREHTNLPVGRLGPGEDGVQRSWQGAHLGRGWGWGCVWRKPENRAKGKGAPRHPGWVAAGSGSGNLTRQRTCREPAAGWGSDHPV